MPTTDYNDLPSPADVERVFKSISRADKMNGAAWLNENHIDPAAIGPVAQIQFAFVLQAESGRYEFQVNDDQVSAESGWHLAVPITRNGKFVDLLLIDCEELTFTTACGRAVWLGRIGKDEVRLHRHPIDWLAAGCTGACHIAPISRAALADLTAAKTIHCDDVHVALEAWDWGFGGEDDELGRFVIDAEPQEITAYYKRQARWKAASKLRRAGVLS